MVNKWLLFNEHCLTLSRVGLIFYALCTKVWFTVFANSFIKSQNCNTMKKVKYARVYEYNRRNKLNADGTAPILIRAYLRGKSKFFKTGIYLEPHQWDNKTLKVKKHPYQLKCEQLIRKLETALENFEWKLMEQGETVTLERLEGYKDGVVKITFTQFYWQELHNQKFSHKSYTDQNQTFEKLTAFRSQIYFNDVNYQFVKNFETYLYSLGLHTNTIGKHHKNLRKYINQAINFGYLKVEENPYRNFKIRSQPTERTFLTEEELEQMEKKIFDSEELNRVKDYFLFSCWTGLRYGDAAKLTGNNFEDTKEGFVLRFTAEKTNKPHRLNLSKLFAGKPEQLIKRYLDKYDQFYFDDPDNPTPIFFGMTNQHINRELKTIAKKLKYRPGLRGKISCHIARHTFGTITSGKLDVHVVQELMQHSKIKETMIYVHLNPNRMDKALDAVKW